MELLSFDPGGNPEKELRYSVYSYNGKMEDGMVFTRSFIVVRNGYKMIERFTHLQDYAGVYRKGSYTPITSNPRANLHYICRMLNFILVQNGASYKVKHVFDITKDMMYAFFADYALSPKKDGTHRGEACINDCVSACTKFMANLSKKFGGYMKVSRSQLYEEKYIKTNYGQRKTIYVPDFCIAGVPEVHTIFRDIPTKAFRLMITLAFRYTPDIAFAMCIQAFSGLRPGEVMNVRQENSPIGPGMFVTEEVASVTRIEIDLRKEYELRSDHVKVGNIKKERIQCVYPRFMQAFCDAYRIHRAWLAGVDCEPDYLPMFVNTYGKALTYSSYLDRFHELVDEHFRPALLKSADPELNLYGQLLESNSLGPHSLRHWFTVQLVLWGESVAGIQYWRGDTNPQSAITYLQNKGDLNRELKVTNDAFADMFMKIGEQMHEDEGGDGNE